MGEELPETLAAEVAEVQAFDATPNAVAGVQSIDATLNAADIQVQADNVAEVLDVFATPNAAAVVEVEAAEATPNTPDELAVDETRNAEVVRSVERKTDTRAEDEWESFF